MDEAEDLELMLTGGVRCLANDELILLYRTANGFMAVKEVHYSVTGESLEIELSSFAWPGLDCRQYMASIP